MLLVPSRCISITSSAHTRDTNSIVVTSSSCSTRNRLYSSTSCRFVSIKNVPPRNHCGEERLQKLHLLGDCGKTCFSLPCLLGGGNPECDRAVAIASSKGRNLKKPKDCKFGRGPLLLFPRSKFKVEECVKPTVVRRGRVPGYAALMMPRCIPCF